MTTLAGNTSGTVGSDNYGFIDGVKTAASFKNPYGVAMDGNESVVVVVRSTVKWCRGILRVLVAMRTAL